MRLEDLVSPGTITTAQALRVSVLKAINYVQVFAGPKGWTSHAVQLSAFFAAAKTAVDKFIRVAVTTVTVAGGGSTANGATRQLTATVGPAGAQDKRVTWTSLDPAKVSVSETGLCTVRVAAAGAVTILATSVDDHTRNATAVVTGT